MTPGSPYQQPHSGRNKNVLGQANQANSGGAAQSLTGNQLPTQSAHLARAVLANNALLQNFQQQGYAKAQQAMAGQWIATGYGQAQSNAEPLKTAEIKLGEIIAYRGWSVTPQGFLRSMSANVIWGPGEVMEGKTKSTTEHNGVYAYKTAKDFLTNLADVLDVYGRVALWGDVIEHELGYRAQFAKVIGLDYFLSREAPHKIGIKELRQKYCPEAA